MYNDTQMLKEDSCHKMIYYNYLNISNIAKTKKRINNSVNLEKNKNERDIMIHNYNYNYNYNYENDDKLNESMEITEQMMNMKEYTEIMKKYKELLSDRIKEDIEFNERSRRNIYIYQKYALEGKDKYKNLELSTNYMIDVLKKVRDFINK